MASKLPHNFIQGGPAEPLSKDLLEGKKRILLNAFDMNGVGHISIGQWQNPEDKSSQKNRLPYWIELAKLLERGKFNALFLADNYGSHDIYKGSHAPAIRAASQWPLYDPFSVISAMAAVTDTLAFGVTASTTFEPPFSLAKRFSTLDHLTNGRIAWNIVTSWSDTAARAHGLDQLPEHDTRYEMAEEYLSLVYKYVSLLLEVADSNSPRLWEGSWADGAVVKDPSTHTYTDPTKIRKIEHQGKFYKSSSAHQVDPSPQRTPVLFQAGMSPAGSSFAAKHAECIFCGGASPALVAKSIEQTRQKARENSRDPYDLKFFVQFTPILGATDQEAQEKYERYRQYALGEGGLALLGSTSGIDVSKFPWDEEFPTDPEHPLMKELTVKQRNRLLARPAGFDRWTPRILAEYQSLGGSGPYKIGSGATVADEMERWITEADVDGFNIGHIVVPGAWEDVIEYLVPELEKRGWLGKDYPVPQGTARENLYGSPGDSHVRKTHPGYQYKFKEDI
ncbi:luciferase-like domain-containing protein [Fusarium solani]|uniref:Luciferase-like domain-containing protein n=1 Tax=Fusarium solani TaxID=169388 RepID=A0A9P9KST9_FUSSL|nr:luciferase-like domain-containing protein [Fusarium solani]KAH7267898.1 luciferase-like domain-containing protein [Fusarium solani]